MSRYLDSHLGHKDGSEYVVGDGETDSLLTGEERETVKQGKETE